MTNKGKVITVAIVAAVVLAGAAGFYFKGGDLMGRLELKMKPAYNDECPSGSGVVTLYSTVSGKSALYGSDFKSFYNALKKEAQSNLDKLACPLKIVMGDTENYGYIVITKDSKVSFKDGDGTNPMVGFTRTIPGDSWHSVSLHGGDALDSDYGSIQIYSEDLNKTYKLYAQKSGDISVARVSPSLY